MFMIMKKHVTQYNGAMAQSIKLYLALGTWTILVSEINVLLVLGFSWDLLTIRKI